MAQITKITLLDDLDGEQADETVEFGIDGRYYEIDLSEEHADALRESLANYISAARRRTSDGRRTIAKARVASPSTRGTSREQLQAIREWARTQGIQVADRGRIPSRVLEAFNEAHTRKGARA